MASEIVLINASGRNSPGWLVMLTSALARHQARILDIGQAVIHDELSLGVLVQLDRTELAVLEADLRREAGREGAVVRFTAIGEAEYEDWVGHHGSPRYIVTVLARGIEARQLAAVTEVVERHGLAVDGIRRLSGRLPLVGVTTGSRGVIEISMRGTLADPARLRADLLEASDRLTFDFSVQQDTVYRRNRRLVAFDMDSTLIQAEVIDELARVHGVGAEVARVTERAMRGEIDFKESFRTRVALLAGLRAAALDEVAARVLLTEGATRLVGALKHFGYRTAIISGGFTAVGERLKRELGIDHVFANALEIEDGRFTGRVRGEIIDAQGKAQLLRRICEVEGIVPAQAIAIGDGANDLPMLSVAGLGVAFHAKPLVRASASHAISNFGLDSVLYLIGFSDRDIAETGM